MVRSQKSICGVGKVALRNALRLDFLARLVALVPKPRAGVSSLAHHRSPTAPPDKGGTAAAANPFVDGQGARDLRTSVRAPRDRALIRPLLRSYRTT